jgi:hypothetical protein
MPRSARGGRKPARRSTIHILLDSAAKLASCAKTEVSRQSQERKIETFDYSLLKNLHGVSDPTNFNFRSFFNEHVELYSVEPIRIVMRSYCGDNLSKPFACPAGQ